MDLPYIYDENGKIVSSKINESKIADAFVVCFSGCKDSQTSSDTKVKVNFYFYFFIFHLLFLG
jgi:hypothetical protein